MPLTKAALLADTVRKLLSRGATSNALHIFNQLPPADVARLLSHLPTYRKMAFELLVEKNLSLASQALSFLDPARRTELLGGVSVPQISRLLGELDPDEVAAFVGELPEELRKEILATLHGKDAADVQGLLQHREQTAGRIMNPNVPCVSQESTVAEAIAWLQQPRELEFLFYLYVVDENQKLVGVLSLRQLLQTRPETRLKDIMVKNVIRVTADTDQEEAAQVVASYNLLAIPVVDATNRLVGVISVDDVIDVINAEATEDMFRLAGVSVQDRVFGPPRTSARLRIPWLFINLGTAFLAAFVVSLFEGTIQKFAFLAIFMPVVAGMGGNAGTQALTVMVRGIALGELRWSNCKKAVFKELAVGVMNGAALGSIVGLVAFLWKGLAVLGLVLGVAMVGNLLVAAAAGTLVPLILLRLRVDPALASSIFVTAFTDSCGFFFFLGLGTLLLSRLG